MSFREYLNEMPKYIDHDYLGFKPMESRALSGLEKKWNKIPCRNTERLIFINGRKTIAIIGLSKWDEDMQSWRLEVAAWVKLELQKSGHYKVRGVHTHEDFRLLGYPYDLYISLYNAGIKLCSDNEQYEGAKPLWKAISRKIHVEVYDEEKDNVIYPKYNEIDIHDSEIWYTDGKHFLKLLRMR